MLETTETKKSRIHLEDYNYIKDLENRRFLTTLSPFAFDVIDEIFYSKRTIPIWKLAKDLDFSIDNLTPILHSFEKIGLLEIIDETITVDKEAKKYFECEILRFHEEFIPDLDFFQELLKKVPIHILPAWYNLSRTSNNIFSSIVDKYLSTPQLFQRHLLEVKADPILAGIIEDLFQSPYLELSSEEVKKKYHLTQESFDEYLLHLEFNFICFAKYKKKKNHWEESLSPLHEWIQYSNCKFCHSSLPSEKVKLLREKDFAFIRDIAKMLQAKEAIYLDDFVSSSTTLQDKTVKALRALFGNLPQNYFLQLLTKIDLLNLGKNQKGYLTVTSIGKEWLEKPLETQALFFYHHPSNSLLDNCIAFSDRSLCEAEKSIKSAYNKWILFETFLQTVNISLDEQTKVTLMKKGKAWKYQYPEYSQEQKAFIHKVIFESLFEAGMVKIGLYQGEECFCATEFAKTFFGL